MTDPKNNNQRCEKNNYAVFALLFFIIILATGHSTNATSAEQSSPAHDVADGRHWKMSTEDGRTGTLVLFQEGTGKMTGGPIELSPKWRPTPDGVCLKPGALLPERCITLVRSGSAFIGLRSGKQAHSNWSDNFVVLKGDPSPLNCSVLKYVF